MGEMDVASGLEGADATGVAESQAGGGRYFADATEAEFGELFAPGVGEGDGVTGGDGEEEFVVFAVGQGGEEGRFGRGLRSSVGGGCRREARCCTGGAADGDGADQEFGSDFAAFHKVAQIASQAIAEVNHGMDGKMFSEPAGFVKTRLELEVLAGERAAEFAGDEEGVAVHSPGAEDAFVAGDFAEEGDGNEEAFGVGGSFAADDGDAVTEGELAHAVVDFLDEIGVEVVGQGESDEGGEGTAGHRGNVAEAAGEGLVADALGGRGAEEMDAFYHGVGLEEEGAAGLAGIQDGAIVTGADDHGGIGGKGRTETGDEIEFVHLTGLGCAAPAVRSARIKLVVLNRLWAVIEAQRLPVFS